MRIAMVSEHASPLAALGGVDAGGQNVHVAALATELARGGHEVTVYTRRDDPTLPERVVMAPGVTVAHVPVGPAAPLPKDELAPFMPAFGAWLARSWAARGVPDVVHSHFWMSGLAALAAAAEVRVPVVHTFHALGSVKRRHQGAADTSPPGRVRAEQRIGRDADVVIATCTDEVAELCRLGVPRGKLRVVPCGVDVTHFSPDPAPGAGTTAAAGVVGDSPTAAGGAAVAGGPTAAPGAAGTAPVPARRLPHRLLTVGRLVERKGVATVVAALPDLPTAELLVAGGPPAAGLAADPEATRLRRLAADLGVADRVHLLGAVAHEDMPALIRSADVVVATPWYEPFGIVPLEAAACGRPVVGSAVGGLLDSVADGFTGLLVPPRDPAALAAALGPLLADPYRRRGMGLAARSRAVDRFAWERVAATTLAVYQSVRHPVLKQVTA
ncbi:glycosyltransferase [Georgenia sp. TF02-10]|uniref:glycosyltransferase n=1 Tax=Georgenia sp. TF02-10 TaxID=2917725 RepID=UPI001FA78619|nr:glycosyltransferase [Georgenia sp. TF02-10]UNX54785.1 glycosyltransferase [Georgenia sp. TF02-10]